MKWLAMLAVIALALVLVSGTVHVVTGGPNGFQLCTKEHWTLSDTFVAREGYEQRLADAIRQGLAEGLRTNSESPRLAREFDVLKALIRCGVIENPFRDMPSLKR